MKTAKSLQLLDVQNNNISPAVGVESIFYEETDGKNITNRKPLSFVSDIETQQDNIKSEVFGRASVTFVDSSKMSNENDPISVYQLEFNQINLGEIKKWVNSELNTRVSNLEPVVNVNSTNIRRINSSILRLTNTIDWFCVQDYFFRDGENPNNSQLSGFRILSEASGGIGHGSDGRPVRIVQGELNGLPSADLYENTEKNSGNDSTYRQWFNNTKNSSYLSIKMGIDAVDSNGKKYHTGSNYFYQNPAQNMLNGSLFFTSNDYEQADPNTRAIYHAPSLQINPNRRFPYLPGYSPLWLDNGNTYILALAADDPSVSRPNSDTPVHMSWINSEALNNLDESIKYFNSSLAQFWNSSINVGNNVSVGSYVNSSINNLKNSINTSIGALYTKDTSTVKQYIDSSINGSKVKLGSINKNGTYYLLSCGYDNIPGGQINAAQPLSNAYIGLDTARNQMWYIQNNNLYGGLIYSTSDERMKKDIKSIEDSDINTFTPKSFTWKDSNKPSFGFIAQEVEKEYPELVDSDSEGYKKVNYDGALSLLVGKLINKINSLELRIQELEEKIR